ncbi:nicotinate-nucleotide pyrophosphorylase [carboxylating] [Caminicella sporogenes DSM 14501]|uniref:Probable nicotinate-nucleotide pyrophosphorylase [carboxylating] n=1 Tax=Caminicella sporogenes DSM 14501 TaxID=1121266 RepID=A0A1M6S8X0_9FIRM|nr:carboxylating nicotinate-nucleotide diphosphorylase [Caminicella sporogenes]RKD26916.1 nicotinate-nucleotide diphosphorylase (carboxylating) [Caminicella sporogenes]SHK41140.1 nicotinate-nucleotide pyrophosphorylase [carboxylating] [Caminicella sporogenes DSM 14501]
MLNWVLVDEIIKNGLKEDINNIDITTDNLIDDESKSMAYMLAKEEGVIAGLYVAERVFKILDKEVNFKFNVKDGDKVEKGTIIAEIKGNTKAILKGERLALNLIQRMSGIATISRKYRDVVKDFPVRIVDTRKTTPGLRILEKYAVRIGGCYNHRYNLSEAVMIKDNHIKAAGGIREAILKVKDKIPHTIKVEVEVESITELKEAIDAGADIVMLDNMELEDMKKAVEIGKGKVIIEASGGITLDKLVQIAEVGVDVISVGALTHSVKAMDISLNII